MRSAINATEGTMGFSKRPFLVPECSVMSVIAYEGAGSEGVRGHWVTIRETFSTREHATWQNGDSSHVSGLALSQAC